MPAAIFSQPAFFLFFVYGPVADAPPAKSQKGSETNKVFGEEGHARKNPTHQASDW